MKKHIIILLFTMSSAGNAQTVNVHMKNGETVKYNSSDVSYVDFSEEGSGTTPSGGYGISGGVNVNLGKKLIYVYDNSEIQITVTYDSFNRLSKIQSEGFGNGSYEFDYVNKIIKVNGKDAYRFVINADGFISEIHLLEAYVEAYGYQEDYCYEYEKGFLTKVTYKKNYNERKIEYTYNEEDLFRHNETRQHIDESSYTSQFTYKTGETLNLGGIYPWTVHLEAPFVRFRDNRTCMMIAWSSGLFGKVSKNLIAESIDNDKNKSSYDYSFDSNGYVSSVSFSEKGSSRVRKFDLVFEK